MRKSWALQALASVAIAAAGGAWAADSGAGTPKEEGTGQPTAKMQGDGNGGTAAKNGAPVTPGSDNGTSSSKDDASSGLKLDERVDRLPAKRGADQDESGAQDNGSSADNGTPDTTAPQNPANHPTTLFPAEPKPPADPGKPGNPVTPTGARIR
jgi:hypothetical protein